MKSFPEGFIENILKLSAFQFPFINTMSRKSIAERHYWDYFLLVVNHSHYDDVIMTILASQITSLTFVYSIVYSGVDLRKHQSSASLAFVREIHRGPVNFPHKWPVTRKMFPFDDVIMAFIQIDYLFAEVSISSSVIFGLHIYMEVKFMHGNFRNKKSMMYAMRQGFINNHFIIVWDV